MTRKPNIASGRALSPIFAVALLLLLCAVVVSVGIGPSSIVPADVIRAILAGPPHGASVSRVIVWDVRLPRIVMAMLVGASLAAAGVAFQSLVRNPLADAYVIGVSSGASVGAEAVFLAGGAEALGGFAGPIAAFCSALVTLMIVYGLARRHGRVDVLSLLLGGVVISSLLTAVSTLLLMLGSPAQFMSILYRLMGSLQNGTLEECGLLSIILIVGVVTLTVQTEAMNVFSLGDESAQQLGSDVERLKAILIAAGSLLTAGTVAMAGMIGFVGLIVPHVARRLIGSPDHRRVLPVAIVCGALLMVCADTIARTIMPGRELPVGAVTAFLGAPFFLLQLRRQIRA